VEGNERSSNDVSPAPVDLISGIEYRLNCEQRDAQQNENGAKERQLNHTISQSPTWISFVTLSMATALREQCPQAKPYAKVQMLETVGKSYTALKTVPPR
jgi:hypothetical protein